LPSERSIWDIPFLAREKNGKRENHLSKPRYLGDIHYGGKRMAWGKGAAAGGTIYLSGADGADPKTGEFPKDVAGQTRMALEKISQRLSEAGSDLQHVVRMVFYVVGRENVEAFRSARREWMSSRRPKIEVPHFASTLLVVAGLASPEMFVEIDVTAVAKR
jgi:enamine deaminase RidA (YjgF/YER057c/UK114 family)